LGCVSLGGCAYTTQVQPSISPAVYSFAEEKLPGTILLYLEDWTETPLSVRSKTHFCSAHTFPISLGVPARSAFQKATTACFKDVIFLDSMPTRERILKERASGVSVVKLNQFTPEIAFQPGFWRASATATAEIYVDVVIYDKNLQRVFSTTIGASRQASGDGGGACEGGAVVLGEATSKALRETVERYVERITSNIKVRGLFPAAIH
jgi:hypothetical protein